jgi:putative hemolysin
LILFAAVAVAASFGGGLWAQAPSSDSAPAPAVPTTWELFWSEFPAGVLLAIVLLLAASAFFSAVEVGFFSLHRVRLRAIASEGGVVGTVITGLMRHPAQLLNTILIGNMTMNIMIGVLLPPRLERFIEAASGLNTITANILTVAIVTVGVLFAAEVSPKVLAVSIAEPIARVSAVPMLMIGWVLAPVRWASLRITEMLFQITRFNDIPPAPFMTDEEIMSVLADSEGQGVIEENEGQMIQKIIESGNAQVKEILVPRPQIVAIDRAAQVGQALELFRRHAFSRMPVFQDDLDHITGVLVAKDLLPYVTRGELERPIGPIARRANFVPETMTIREFIRYSQRKHMHMSIAVDEYGGTEGLVTLDDALEEVVGDIRDAAAVNGKQYKRIARGCYRVEGSIALDDLSRLIGVEFESGAHETAAGYFMHELGRIPAAGDSIERDGVVFTVEEVQGRHASALRVETRRPPRQEQPA